MNEPELERGDIVRVRPLGTGDEWCVCRVDLLSPNKEAMGLVVVDGALRMRGGIMTNAVAVLIRDGGAFELMTKTELEMEKYAERA